MNRGCGLTSLTIGGMCGRQADKHGSWYRVSVVDAVRNSLPIKTARAKLRDLGVTARWFRDHTVHTPYTSVTCEARTGHNIKAFKDQVRRLKLAA